MLCNDKAGNDNTKHSLPAQPDSDVGNSPDETIKLASTPTNDTSVNEECNDNFQGVDDMKPLKALADSGSVNETLGESSSNCVLNCNNGTVKDMPISPGPHCSNKCDTYDQEGYKHSDIKLLEVVSDESLDIRDTANESGSIEGSCDVQEVCAESEPVSHIDSYADLELNKLIEEVAEVVSQASLAASDPQLENLSNEIVPSSNEDLNGNTLHSLPVTPSPDSDSSYPSLNKSATPPVVNMWVWGSSLPDQRFSKRSKRKGRLGKADSQSVCSNLGGGERMFSPEILSASLNDIDKLDLPLEYEHLIDELEDAKVLNTELADKLFINSNSMLDYEQLISSSVLLDDENRKMKEENDKLKQERKKLELHKDVEISDLEKNVLKLMSDLEIANKTIRHVSEESERKIKAVEEKYESKIAHIDKKFIETIKEKDILSSSLDETRAARTKLAASKETFIKSLSAKTEELERLRAKLHFSMQDCIKLKHESDEKAVECKKLTMEVKNTKDDLSSAAIKIQWANRSLKSETDAHQLTRQKLSGMDARIRESKEEADMIRANCQAMINKYQNSEEIQSNALGNKLDKLEEEHRALNLKYETLTKEFQDQAGQIKAQQRASETIKNQLFDKEAQYQSLKEEFRNTVSEKDNAFNQLEDLDEQLNSYNDLKTQLKNSYETNQVLTKQATELRDELDFEKEGRDELNDKERSNMDYFQKISAKNADLQLAVNSLRLEGEGLHRQVETMSAERNEMSEKFSLLTITHDTLSEETTKQIVEAKAEIDQLQSTKASLEIRIEEMINAAAVAKKKHTSGNKDLVRQIEQFRKQIEKQEESMRRSESINSLMDKDRALSGASSEADDSLSISGDSGATVSFEQARLMLIERLCMLQKQLAKRQEKIEFCESHISTLTRDIQKKSRVVQSLLLRVETGSRTALVSETYKAGQDSSGLLSNLYGTKSNGMTLKLSTEINEKLQQVLEDTLFKNITLTENIKTLGEEIDRLNGLQRS